MLTGQAAIAGDGATVTGRALGAALALAAGGDGAALALPLGVGAGALSAQAVARSSPQLASGPRIRRSPGHRGGHRTTPAFRIKAVIVAGCEGFLALRPAGCGAVSPRAAAAAKRHPPAEQIRADVRLASRQRWGLASG